ncbi:hypothetical protein [uncultured Desulfosarcina sp.]|uniref:hypothetical protein n=1 Tax=uncultured Desulfosarcina sp. TaxID=218289 RepID=UPI0029C8427A|nr:hypothetical protein [uncultured Desulfosarcina sp.]
MIYLNKLFVDDPGANLALRDFPSSGEYDLTSRISRDKTLDGGGVLTHHGTSFFDRTFRVEGRVSEAEAAVLKQFQDNGILVRISFWEGCFSGHIYQLNIQRDGNATIVFYFKEKLS